MIIVTINNNINEKKNLYNTQQPCLAFNMPDSVFAINRLSLHV